MSFRSLRHRIVMVFVGLLVLVMGGVLALVHSAGTRIAADEARHEVEIGAKVFGRLLEQNQRQLETAAAVLSADFAFREAIATQDGATVRSVIGNHGRRIHAQVMMVADTAGRMIASTQRDIAGGDRFPFPDLIEAAEAAGRSAGLRQMHNGHLYQVVLVPIMAPTRIAWVAMGFRVDDGWAREVAGYTGLDVHIVRDISDAGPPVLLATSLDRSDAAAPVDTLCLPLTAQRETLGLLYFEAPAGNPGALSGPEIYLDMLAENIGLAIANLQLRETLREMALADPLTGLSNRRQLDQLLGIQIAQAERLGQDLGCLMIDVDHFKRFNDVHGHDAGDMVLREVGKVLAGVTRDAGLAFRYGGEEFMLLLPGLSVEGATERAEEIRTRVAALALGSEAGNMGPVTVSIGVAITPLHCPPDRLVRTADAALLRAKAMGRDRVEVAQQRDSFAAV